MTKKIKGKWAQELRQAQHLSDILKAVEIDVAVIQGKTPAEVILIIGHKLDLIKKNIRNSSKHYSFYDFRLPLINSIIVEIESAIPKIKAAGEQADRIAKSLTQEFAMAVKRPIDYYTKRKAAVINRKPFHSKSTIYLFSRKAPYSVFENSVDPHQRTWALMRPRLNELAVAAGVTTKVKPHNQLSVLLLPSDEDFVNALSSGKVNLGGEIGYLGIQRLKEICARTTTSERALRSSADAILERFITSAESLFRYDINALEKEIHKLALYAILHPDDKIIWLGSGRTVIANITIGTQKAIENDTHLKGIYLNVDDTQWTWALNRAFLQAAAKMGYEFRLAEQHYPDVEQAISSGNPVLLIEQLAREVRSLKHRSQYHGGDSPTATPQEILALMDMGCQGHKNADASYSLVPSMRASEEPELSSKHERPSNGRIQRRHSSAQLHKLAPLPPLPKGEHLTTPGSSLDGRKKASTRKI